MASASGIQIGMQTSTRAEKSSTLRLVVFDASPVLLHSFP